MSKVEDEIQRAYDKWLKDDVWPTTRRVVLDFANKLVEEAIKYRESMPEKHDFTGNLLNSIVACVYEDNKPIEAFFSKDRVNRPIRRKMTANGKGTPGSISTSKPKGYHFKVDYEGSDSVYSPVIITDAGKGTVDAAGFWSDYKPQGNAKFHIALAYTVEYATWLETFCHTVGFADTYSYAQIEGYKIFDMGINSAKK